MASPSPGGARPQFIHPVKVGMKRTVAPPSPGVSFASPPAARTLLASPINEQYNPNAIAYQHREVFSPPKTPNQVLIFRLPQKKNSLFFVNFHDLLFYVLLVNFEKYYNKRIIFFSNIRMILAAKIFNSRMLILTLNTL